MIRLCSCRAAQTSSEGRKEALDTKGSGIHQCQFPNSLVVVVFDINGDVTYPIWNDFPSDNVDTEDLPWTKISVFGEEFQEGTYVVS